MEAYPLPLERLVWEAMELAEEARAIARNPEADPELRERCRRLDEVWRAEYEVLKANLDEYVDAPLMEEDLEAAPPEVREWVERGDRELEQSGERFQAALADFVDAGGLEASPQ